MAPADVVPVLVAMGGADCELISGGWFAQPANAWSSGAYLVAATYVLTRRGATAAPRVAVGAGALAAVGIGSFLYHGPQPSWGDIAHDLSITALLVALVAVRSMRLAAVAVAAAALGAVAGIEAPLVHAVLGAGVVLQEMRAERGRGTVVAAAALAVAAALFALGRTGGPLCSPGSLAQPHAGWHVFTAVSAATVLARDRSAVRRAT